MITYIALVTTMFFWGGTFVAGRLLATSVPPASAAFLRFAIASAVLVLLTRISQGQIAPSFRQAMVFSDIAGSHRGFQLQYPHPHRSGLDQCFPGKKLCRQVARFFSNLTDILKNFLPNPVIYDQKESGRYPATEIFGPRLDRS
jgi:EamA-like transporter family